MKNIIIVNSHGTFGGNIVLEKLSLLLREHGLNAKTFYIKKFPGPYENMTLFWRQWFSYTIKYHIRVVLYSLFKNTSLINKEKFRDIEQIPVKGVTEKYLPFFNKKNTIVIYPEVVYGNFLNARNVVHWLLYHYKWTNDTAAYNTDDLFICYRMIFNDWTLNPNGYEVTISHFDTELYRRYNYGQREGNCYIIRKGQKRSDLPFQYDGPIIDDLPEKEKVEVLNKVKYCYCYDTQTFYARIAAICGCIPIVMLEPGKSKADYRSEGELYTPGVAWGNALEEIEYAKRTREELLKEMDFDCRNNENINKMKDILIRRFG